MKFLSNKKFLGESNLVWGFGERLIHLVYAPEGDRISFVIDDKKLTNFYSHSVPRKQAQFIKNKELNNQSCMVRVYQIKKMFHKPKFFFEIHLPPYEFNHLFV